MGGIMTPLKVEMREFTQIEEHGIGELTRY
jgi:hypothetical protein